MHWKKIILSAFLVLPLIMAGGFGVYAHAEGMNPCSAKNPCGMKNPCSMKPKPIRKKPVTDSGKLLQMGEKLWSDNQLGKSGLACATCHADGKGLKTEPFPKYLEMPNDILTLDQMINFCLVNPMKGKILEWNSLEMTALAAYVKTYAKEEGKPANPCTMKNPCMMKNPCGMKNH